MRKSIALSMVTVLLLFAGTSTISSSAQDTASDPKPTFISPTPGLYVHGWPAFTVSYPKEWVMIRELPGDAFRAGGTRPELPPGSYSPQLAIGIHVTSLPLEDWAKDFMPGIERFLTDVRVLYEKPSRLKDGFPAREIEVEGRPKYGQTGGKVTEGPQLTHYFLMTKRDIATWVYLLLVEEKARFNEDLKKIAYSLTFLPDREEPVAVPTDVRAFLEMFCTDMVSRDVTAIMAHFSDRYLHSGVQKAYQEQWYRTHPEMFPPPGRTLEPVVTVYEGQGDRAYVDGFLLVKTQDGTTNAKAPMNIKQIIKEQGRWKWFGNQR